MACKIRSAVISLAVVLLCPFPARAQAPQRRGWLDHWRQATFSLGRVSHDQNNRDFFEVVGTGILVATDPHTGYVVTAKHVFFDRDQNWHPNELRIRFAWQEHKSVYDELGITLKLRDDSGRDLWNQAEDGSDVAAIPAAPANLGRNEVEGIFPNEFAGDDDLYDGAAVIVLGYPGVVGNEYLVKAVSRAGIIAWTSPDKPVEATFLVDANILPGNSGGPVIRIPTGVDKSGTIFSVGGKPTLVGLVSKGAFQQSRVALQVPGVLEPIVITTQVPGIGSFGVVEPVNRLARLLASFSKRN